MKANRAYRMIVTRASAAPAVLADPQSVDHIEIVDVDDGEVVFFWDVTPVEGRRLARALRADLSRLEADEFLAAWSAAEAPAEGEP